VQDLEDLHGVPNAAEKLGLQPFRQPHPAKDRRSGMDRQTEMRDLRRTMREQEAWGKFSVRSANRLAELERQERLDRWGFDPLCLATWTFVLAYCILALP
jgi:hypothetical protein